METGVGLNTQYATQLRMADDIHEAMRRQVSNIVRLENARWHPELPFERSIHGMISGVNGRKQIGKFFRVSTFRMLQSDDIAQRVPYPCVAATRVRNEELIVRPQ